MKQTHYLIECTSQKGNLRIEIDFRGLISKIEGRWRLVSGSATKSLGRGQFST